MEEIFDSSIFSLSNEEIKKIKNEWNKFSLQLNQIKTSEVYELLSRLNVNVPDYERTDIEENESIEFDEFVDLYEECLLKGYTNRVPKIGKLDFVSEALMRSKEININNVLKIKEAWDRFDSSRYLLNENLFQLLNYLQICVPEYERDKILEALDKNNDGVIEFVEFVKSYETGLFKDYSSKQLKKLNTLPIF